MRRMLSFVLAAIFVAMVAVPAQAQYGNYDNSQISYAEAVRIASARRAAVLGYDPYYYNNYYDPYDMYYRQRPYDPCAGQITTVGGGALGAGGGALIGAVVGGRKGAAIGAVSGAVVGGVIASRNNRNNPCVSSHRTASIENQVMPAPPEEQASTSTRPVAGPATNAGEGEFTLSSSSRFRSEVYYDGTYVGRLNPGSSMKGEYPEKDKRYEAYLLVPNEEGGISSLKARIVPGDNGITFSEPETAQGR